MKKAKEEPTEIVKQLLKIDFEVSLIRFDLNRQRTTTLYLS